MSKSRSFEGALHAWITLLGHIVAHVSALQALAESTRMDVNDGMDIVVSGSGQRTGSTETQMEMSSNRADVSLFV